MRHCLLHIPEAMARNVATRSATECDIQKELVRYIHGSQDRDGGRAERKKKNKHFTSSESESEGTSIARKVSDSDDNIIKGKKHSESGGEAPLARKAKKDTKKHKSRKKSKSWNKQKQTQRSPSSSSDSD